MGIRLPLTTILDKTFSATLPGAESVAGVVAQNFYLPTDVDNVVMKIYQASISGASSNVNVLFQTTDDGGTTWYDVARSGVARAADFATSITTGTAIWTSIPVVSPGVRSTVLDTFIVSASVLTKGSILSTIGQAASSTLGVNQISGLPILGPLNRICLIYTGATTTNDGVKVKVMANSQAPTA